MPYDYKQSGGVLSNWTRNTAAAASVYRDGCWPGKPRRLLMIALVDVVVLDLRLETLVCAKQA